MGPGEMTTPAGKFTDKVPPSFDGRENYSAFREDVLLWTHLTGLEPAKQGAALVGQLSGEAKTSAKSLSTKEICADNGVEKILERLDKSYAIDASNQLDIDLASFLDFTWQRELTVEQFVAGFHSRLDRISSLQIDDKLKGHLLLRQSLLPPYERNMLVGASSGKYEIGALTSAMRSAFMHHPTEESNMTTNPHPPQPQRLPDNTYVVGRATPSMAKARRGARQQKGKHHSDSKPTFYTYKTSSPHNLSGAVLDSGACASIVGKETLDKALKDLGLTKLPDATPSRPLHRFGDHKEAHNTICAVKFPFKFSCDNGKDTAAFDIAFDVIEGGLPFLVGLPSLIAMKSNMNFNHKTLGLAIGDRYLRLSLDVNDSHIYLPFVGAIKHRLRDVNAKIGKSARYPHSTQISEYEADPCGNELPPCHQSSPKLEPIMGSYASTSPPRSGGHLTTAQLKKLHLHLKHASVSQLREYLRSANMWSSTMENLLANAVGSCRCQLGKPPESHPIVGPNPPSSEIQTHLSIDVINLEGQKFLHSLDRTTGWSEIGHLRSRELDLQVRTFKRIQLHRHGTPLTIQADGEFHKGAFATMCTELGINLVKTPADSHECNGAVERANRTLREHFNRLRAYDGRTAPAELAFEALHAKNTNRGGKLASSFELLFNRRPRLSNLVEPPATPVPSIVEHNAHVLRKRIRLMLRSKIRNTASAEVGDSVFIWRDKKGWIGPCIVQESDPYGVRVSHNGKQKSASHNRVRCLTKKLSVADSCGERGALPSHQEFPLESSDDSYHKEARTGSVKIPTTHPQDDQPPNESSTEDSDGSDTYGGSDIERMPQNEPSAGADDADCEGDEINSRTQSGGKNPIPARELAEVVAEGERFSGSDISPGEIPLAARTRSQSNRREALPSPILTRSQTSQQASQFVVHDIDPSEYEETDQEFSESSDSDGDRESSVSPGGSEDISSCSTELSSLDSEASYSTGSSTFDSEMEYHTSDDDSESSCEESSQLDGYTDPACRNEPDDDTWYDINVSGSVQQTGLRIDGNDSMSQTTYRKEDRPKTETGMSANRKKTDENSKSDTDCAGLGHHFCFCTDAMVQGGSGGYGAELKADQTSSMTGEETHNIQCNEEDKNYMTKARPTPRINEEERKEAYKKEYGAWIDRGAHVRVVKSSVGPSSNVIGSHVVYRRKDDGSVKARIVPWGHRDPEKNFLRCDSPCVSPEIFRLVLSLAAENRWALGQMDVSTAFLQAKGFHREVFVRPPKEAADPDGLWKLQAAAYGLADSGRLWYRTSNEALIRTHRLSRSRFEPTLYFRKKAGGLVFALATQVDNYIYTGTCDELADFEKFLQKEFVIGALDRNNFDVLGCEIRQFPNNAISLSQKARQNDINSSSLEPVSQKTEKCLDRPATGKEIHAYRSVLGKMLYIGRMSNPIMLYHASNMATKLPALQKRHLRTLQTVTNHITKTVPNIIFNIPPHGAKDFGLEVVSDASMSAQTEGGGRGGCLIFRRCGDVVHPIYWSARKLRRVARSSSTAEILAASDAVGTMRYIQKLINELTYHHSASAFYDSRSLLNLSTTIHEPTEVQNKIDLACLREAFDPSIVNMMAWLPGYYNPADALTKDNRTTAALLLQIFREGKFPYHPETEFRAAEEPLIAGAKDPIKLIENTELVADDNSERK